MKKRHATLHARIDAIARRTDFSALADKLASIETALNRLRTEDFEMASATEYLRDSVIDHELRAFVAAGEIFGEAISIDPQPSWDALLANLLDFYADSSYAAEYGKKRATKNASAIKDMIERYRAEWQAIHDEARKEEPRR